ARLRGDDVSVGVATVVSRFSESGTWSRTGAKGRAHPAFIVSIRPPAIPPPVITLWAERMSQGLHDQASLQQMLYDTLDRSDDIVLILEQAGDNPEDIVVASANGAFCRTSGYSQSDLVGRSLPSLAAPDADPARC